MSHAQWQLEYLALREKETEERKERNALIEEVYTLASKTLQEMMIRLLGLNIGTGAQTNEDGRTPYIPLVLTHAAPEMVQRLMDADKAEEALKDENITKDLEILSELNPAKDLEKLLNPTPLEVWHSEEHQALIRSMGVKVVK